MPTATIPKADAILIPKGYVRQKGAYNQHTWANREFGPLCGCVKFWYQDFGNYKLGTPMTSLANHVTDLNHNEVYFEGGHPLAGENRFNWFALENPDGKKWQLVGEVPDPVELPGIVKLGYKRTDIDYEDPDVIVLAADYQAKQLEKIKTMMQTALADPEIRPVLQAKMNNASDEEMELLESFYEKSL